MRQMKFSRVLDRFKWDSIEIVDTVGAYVDGVWKETELEGKHRTIQAIPLAMSPEELELYSNGEDSAAGITLTTKAVLYFSDITAYEQQPMQSYAIYQGYRFRVMGENFMRGNVDGITIYSLVRYIR